MWMMRHWPVVERRQATSANEGDVLIIHLCLIVVSVISLVLALTSYTVKTLW